MDDNNQGVPENKLRYLFGDDVDKAWFRKKIANKITKNTSEVPNEFWAVAFDILVEAIELNYTEIATALIPVLDFTKEEQCKLIRLMVSGEQIELLDALLENAAYIQPDSNEAYDSEEEEIPIESADVAFLITLIIEEACLALCPSVLAFALERKDSKLVVDALVHVRQTKSLLCYLIATSEEKDSEALKQVLTLLLNKGSHVDAQNEDGYTALQLAIIKEMDKAILQLLLTHGASWTLCNQEGLNAFKIAELTAVEGNNPFPLVHVTNFIHSEKKRKRSELEDVVFKPVRDQMERFTKDAGKPHRMLARWQQQLEQAPVSQSDKILYGWYKENQKDILLKDTRVPKRQRFK